MTITSRRGHAGSPPAEARPPGGAQELASGTLVAGRYEIASLLGRGSMGSVYRARERRLDRPVALKVLHAGLAGDRTQAERFLREARLAARVTHKNVLAVYEADVWEGRPFIAMELVEGRSLADALRAGLPLADGVRVLALVARALHAAHGAGLVHRDLKPENVLVGPERRGSERVVKVVDWGIARSLAAPRELTATGVVLGTPGYMAPEQITDGALGPATDLYALGVMLFRLVAGRPPFPSGSVIDVLMAHLRQEAPPLQDLVPDCPEPLAQLAARLLDKDPSRRPASADLVADELERPLEGARDRRRARERPRPSSEPPTTRRRRAGWAAAAVVSAALATAVGRYAGTEPAPAFRVHRLELADVDEVLLDAEGEPPPGARLGVRPRAAGLEPFEVPLEPRGAAEPPARARRVPLGRALATAATAAVLGVEAGAPATFALDPLRLPWLAPLARPDGPALVTFLRAFRVAAAGASEPLEATGFTRKDVTNLTRSVPLLLPPGSFLNGPGARLLLPLLLLEALDVGDRGYAPPWGAQLGRLGFRCYPSPERPVAGRLLFRATVRVPKYDSGVNRELQRTLWVHAPEQVAAARLDPAAYIRISNQFSVYTGEASAQLDDWQEERRFRFDLAGLPARDARVLLVMDLRWHAPDRLLLVRLNGREPYPVVRPNTVRAPGRELLGYEGCLRHEVPLDPADLVPGANELVVRSRLLVAATPLYGTRLEGVYIVEQGAAR